MLRSSKSFDFLKYSETSVILTNWDRTLFQISESPNFGNTSVYVLCKYACMFMEVMKWTTGLSLGNTTLFWNLDRIA
jgi:hypothetical protein